MRFRSFFESINGPDFRDPSRAIDLSVQHRDDLGLIFWFRYPPLGTFGDIAPYISWKLIGVYIDGSFVHFLGAKRAEPLWVALAAGAHHVEIRTEPGGGRLAGLSVELNEEFRVVEVVPAPRHSPEAGSVRVIDPPPWA